MFSPGDRSLFSGLVDNMLHSDYFCVLPDFDEYVKCQERVGEAFLVRLPACAPLLRLVASTALDSLVTLLSLWPSTAQRLGGQQVKEIMRSSLKGRRRNRSTL